MRCNNGIRTKPGEGSLLDTTCWCCQKPHKQRGDNDPWEGRLDGYCDDCATARCDAYPGECPNKSHPAKPGEGSLPASPTEGALDKLIRVTTVFRGAEMARLRGDARRELSALHEEIVRIRNALNRERTYRESQEGLPEGTIPRV